MAVTRGLHLIGKVLGSYTLERLLGYGGSSAVFLARQEDLETKVAVKVFLPRTGMDRRMQRDFYRRFLHEAEAASKLDHPNILPIYSYGEQEGLPYIVMPYMPGGTLAEYMAKRHALSLQEAQWYLEQLTIALDYAHAHGCVHCDVKPANILLDSAGHVILSDFGIARLMPTDGPSEETEIKLPEALMGTPDYISPEQALGRTLDGRSDVYSLGITFFFLLSSRLPFKADSTIALALLHVHEHPPSLALMRADVTPELDHVMHKALAKDPDQRFQSAGEFYTAFSEAVAQSEILARSRNKVSAIPGSLPVTVVTRQLAQRPLWESFSVSPFRLLFIGLVLLVILGILSYSILSLARHSAWGIAKTVVIATATVRPPLVDLLKPDNNWPTSSTFFFDTGKQNYHIVNNSERTVALAPYYGHVYRNFRLEVTMTEVHRSADGSDYQGIVFRANGDQTKYYLFEIAPGADNQYGFLRYAADEHKWSSILTGTVSSILSTSGASNTLTIDAQNNSFTFLINGHPIDKPVSDSISSPLLSGQIGLYVESKGTEVAFSHLHIALLK